MTETTKREAVARFLQAMDDVEFIAKGSSNPRMAVVLFDAVNRGREIAALAPERTGDGVWVPREPTDAMIDAMDQAVFTNGNVIDAYRAMIAAANPAHEAGD